MSVNVLGVNIKRANYSDGEKLRIVKRIMGSSNIEDDFIALKREKNTIVPLSPRGLNVVNTFTMIERLNTVSKTGISFYDLWKNKDIFKQKKYVAKMIEYYSREKGTNENDIKMWFRIYNLYYGAISVFRPSMAIIVYNIIKPTSVLDFTMGWGGRLVGACAIDLHSYIGIDSNKNLKEHYQDLVRFMRKMNVNTNINLLFKDALDVDYSKLEYDAVLTSPPYFNIERYSHQPHMSDDNWISLFYIPLFKKTFKGMKKGGHYCLNIPQDIYTNVAIKLFGTPKVVIPMAKYKRQQGEKYKEFIYIWQKN